MEDLRKQVGLGKVKDEIEKLVDMAAWNYNKELSGEKVDMISLHRLFLGNPGTQTHPAKFPIAHWRLPS